MKIWSHFCMKDWHVVSFIKVYSSFPQTCINAALSFSSSLTFPAISISSLLSLYFSQAFYSLPEVFCQKVFLVAKKIRLVLALSMHFIRLSLSVQIQHSRKATRCNYLQHIYSTYIWSSQLQWQKHGMITIIIPFVLSYEYDCSGV